MPFVALIYADDADDARAIRAEHGDNVIGLYHFPVRIDGPNVEELNGCSGSCRAGVAWTRHPKNQHMMHVCGRRNSRWFNFVRGALFDLFGKNLVKRPPNFLKNPSDG